MDQAKLNELNELRVKRSQVIAGLRARLDALQVPDDLKTLLHALVSLQETADLLDRWERYGNGK